MLNKNSPVKPVSRKRRKNVKEKWLKKHSQEGYKELKNLDKKIVEEAIKKYITFEKVKKIFLNSDKWWEREYKKIFKKRLKLGLLK